MNEYMTLLKSFARDEGLIRFQIESYNDFIENRIPNIIKQIKEIKPEVPDLGEFRIKLGKFKVGKPLGTDIWGPWTKEADGSERPILPQESRIRNLTYSAPMYLEMTPNLNGIDSETITVNFGDLPVMLKSKICPLSKMDRQELIRVGEDPDDPGGYFIVNGTERVLVLIEEISPNKILVESPSTPNVTNIARIHSERDGYIQRHIIERRNDGIIRINFANVNKMPIVILLRALGLETDKDIITFLSDDPEVQQEFYPNLFETQSATSKEAIEEIADFLKITQKEYRQDKVNKLLDKYLLPHLGQDKKYRINKALYLAKATEKIIKNHLKKVPKDDIDHYSNKRLKLSGDLLEILFRSVLLGKWGLITRITYNYQKLTKRGRFPPLQSIVESNVLTNQIISAIAIGSWVGGRTGVSQRLERGSFVKTVSHTRNVLSPLTSTQEHFEARVLHPTQWGKIDPSQTPEGATIGLRKYLAIMGQITKGATEKEVKILEDILLKEVDKK
ncbi:MAG: DNA-directed RNA polymerase subunit B'' [Candidatus Aenigmatarchaeota archaeon]|nr:DNA-directed RNA polymerase subunit B'' [Candidatus Aenigmarchaeota archaeon]